MYTSPNLSNYQFVTNLISPLHPHTLRARPLEYCEANAKVIASSLYFRRLTPRDKALSKRKHDNAVTSNTEQEVPHVTTPRATSLSLQYRISH